MTDEFICHASSPRQLLQHDDKLPKHNPVYVKLILTAQSHWRNFAGACAAIVLGRWVSVGERALKSRSPPPVMIPRLYSIVLFSA